jgi:hypothetical protein
MDDLGTIKDKLDTIIDLLTEIKNSINTPTNVYNVASNNPADPRCCCDFKSRYDVSSVICPVHDLTQLNYSYRE